MRTPSFVSLEIWKGRFCRLSFRKSVTGRCITSFIFIELLNCHCPNFPLLLGIAVSRLSCWPGLTSSEPHWQHACPNDDIHRLVDHIKPYKWPWLSDEEYCILTVYRAPHRRNTEIWNISPTSSRQHYLHWPDMAFHGHISHWLRCYLGSHC